MLEQIGDELQVCEQVSVDEVGVAAEQGQGLDIL